MPYSLSIEQEYCCGRKIHWSGFSSTTSNIQTAIEFSTLQGIIAKIKVYNAKNIRRYSFIPNEDEYLLSPNSKFVVVSKYVSSTPKLQKLFGPDYTKYNNILFLKLTESKDTFVW